jgi:hypothetical protein
MTRKIAQNIADLEISRMRMDQARDRLADAVIAGNHDSQPRLEMVHAASIEDYRDLMQERAFMDRHDYA